MSKPKELDQSENRLVDLLADGSMPRANVRLKLIEIKAQRNRIEAALTNTSEELSVGTTVLRHALDLIADPYSLYLDAAPDVRRLLNETFFECFYIDDLEDATALRIADDKTVMFADLHSAARNHPNRASDKAGTNPRDAHLRTVTVSNKEVLVVPAGFEPATSRV